MSSGYGTFKFGDNFVESLVYSKKFWFAMTGIICSPLFLTSYLAAPYLLAVIGSFALKLNSDNYRQVRFRNFSTDNWVLKPNSTTMIHAKCFGFDSDTLWKGTSCPSNVNINGSFVAGPRFYELHGNPFEFWNMQFGSPEANLTFALGHDKGPEFSIFIPKNNTGDPVITTDPSLNYLIHRESTWSGDSYLLSVFNTAKGLLREVAVADDVGLRSITVSESAEPNSSHEGSRFAAPLLFGAASYLFSTLSNVGVKAWKLSYGQRQRFFVEQSTKALMLLTMGSVEAATLSVMTSVALKVANWVLDCTGYDKKGLSYEWINNASTLTSTMMLFTNPVEFDQVPSALGIGMAGFFAGPVLCHAVNKATEYYLSPLLSPNKGPK